MLLFPAEMVPKLDGLVGSDVSTADSATYPQLGFIKMSFWLRPMFLAIPRGAAI
jgi:hypothetical protein